MDLSKERKEKVSRKLLKGRRALGKRALLPPLILSANK